MRVRVLLSCVELRVQLGVFTVLFFIYCGAHFALGSNE